MAEPVSAELDALVGGINDKLETLEATLHALSRIRGRCSSEDGSVTAEVDGDGALTGLWLADSVTSHAPAEVSRLILWACRRAAAEATAQRSRIVARLNDSLAPAETIREVGGRPG
ncbi:YbaB/EbfC family nucleoid-associated protein [Nocardia niigatensis]|uniref:YbaB/EbfC family nucleoid-associated protein n=1 Tax=Nocardia niigatensis TaxID=209249 RepID=UPI0002E7B947|nr:YbaB/EbfC family nucleoid-associated protein [Nocardia niigatensis]